MPNVRLRYSLLTLLILTALVAGGAWYYSRPRRAVLSQPPTPHQQAMIDLNPELDGLLEYTEAQAVEYEYKRAGEREEWISVAGRGLQRPMAMFRVNAPTQEWCIVNEASQAQLERERERSGQGYEKIVAWVVPCATPVLPSTTPTAGKIKRPTFAFQGEPTSLQCYFITEAKQIFRVTAYSGTIHTTPIAHDEIPADWLRARVAEELNLIPAQPKP